MKVSRLRKRAEFVRMTHSAQRAARPGLVLQYNSITDSSEIRVGFTVTKKVGNAVVRNRLRRRLKAAFTEAAASISPGDYVVIGRHLGLERPYELLVQDISSAAQQIISKKK